MSEFKIKISNVRGIIQDQNDIARQIKELEGEIRQVEYGLSFEIAQKERIRQRLKSARETTSLEYKGIYNATKTLNQIADTYETTELKLAGKEVNESKFEPITNIADIIKLMITNLSEGQALIPSIIKPVIPPGALISIWDFLQSGEAKSTSIRYNTPIDSGDWKKEIPWYSENKEELKDSKINTKLKVFGEKWGNSDSVFHLEEMNGNKEGTHNSSKLDFWKREAAAEIYGGIYSIDSKTGKKIFRPAIGASAGCSISALSMEQEAQIGDKYLGAYIKAEGTAGKVAVKGDIAAGLWDKDGKFNPTLHGGASAEALLLEASAKAGVKVLGADVGVKAGVNVGIGAHAEFGYKDGKFSADVGASIGIGGSIKLEVDIGGVVDAITGITKAIWK